MLHVNIMDNNFRLPPHIHKFLAGWVKAGADVLLALLIIGVVIAMVLIKYGSAIFGG
jgi:hypothetical protein